METRQKTQCRPDRRNNEDQTEDTMEIRQKTQWRLDIIHNGDQTENTMETEGTMETRHNGD